MELDRSCGGKKTDLRLAVSVLLSLAGLQYSDEELEGLVEFYAQRKQSLMALQEDLLSSSGGDWDFGDSSVFQSILESDPGG